MEKIKSLLPINFELIGNPVNWVIVMLMLAIAGLGLAYIVQHSAPVETKE